MSKRQWRENNSLLTGRNLEKKNDSGSVAICLDWLGWKERNREEKRKRERRRGGGSGGERIEHDDCLTVVFFTFILGVKSQGPSLPNV